MVETKEEMDERLKEILERYHIDPMISNHEAVAEMFKVWKKWKEQGERQ